MIDWKSPEEVARDGGELQSEQARVRLDTG